MSTIAPGFAFRNGHHLWARDLFDGEADAALSLLWRHHHEETGMPAKGLTMNVRFALSQPAPRRNAFIGLALLFFVGALATCYLAQRLTPWDFIAFWGAGKALNAGLDPYAPATWRQLAIPAGFYSPIFLGLLFQPIAALLPALYTAKLVWTVGNIVGGVALSLMLMRLSGVRITWTSALIGIALLFAFEPFTGGVIYLGQTDVLVVLATAVSWLLLEQRRRFLAGFVFCVGATNPHLILGIGVYYLYRAIFRREYALLLGLLTGGASLLAICLLYFNYTLEWVTRVLPAKQIEAAFSPTQLTVLHLVVDVGAYAGIPTSLLVRLGEGVTVLLALVVLLLAVRIWRRSNGRATPIEMAAAVTLSVVSTTFAYHQDLLVCALLAPSIVYVWRHTYSIDQSAFLAVCASTFLFSSLTGLINDGVYEHRLPFYAVAPALVGLMMLTQLRASRWIYRRLAVWGTILLAFSLAGDLLPVVVGLWVTQLEIVVFFLGLLAFLRGAYLFAVTRSVWGGEMSTETAPRPVVA